MKGVIFNLFESFVAEGWGQDTYDELLKSTTLKTTDPFVGPGTYPDEDLIALVTKACEMLDVPAPDAIRAFGKFTFGQLAQKFPNFLEGKDDAKSFLKTVEDVVHTETKKLLNGSVLPTFQYEDPAPDRLIMKYQSPRKLCHLMEGLLDGVAEHYKTTITREQVQCMHDGAQSCDFHLTFAS